MGCVAFSTFFNHVSACRYKISGTSISTVCRHNAVVAMKNGRSDLAKNWLIAAKFESFLSINDKRYLKSFTDAIKDQANPRPFCNLRKKNNRDIKCSCPYGDKNKQAIAMKRRPGVENLMEMPLVRPMYSESY